jgi:hypothetical protein
MLWSAHGLSTPRGRFLPSHTPDHKVDAQQKPTVTTLAPFAIAPPDGVRSLLDHFIGRPLHLTTRRLSKAWTDNEPPLRWDIKQYGCRDDDLEYKLRTRMQYSGPEPAVQELLLDSSLEYCALPTEIWTAISTLRNLTRLSFSGTARIGGVVSTVLAMRALRELTHLLRLDLAWEEYDSEPERILEWPALPVWGELQHISFTGGDFPNSTLGGLRGSPALRSVHFKRCPNVNHDTLFYLNKCSGLVDLRITHCGEFDGLPLDRLHPKVQLHTLTFDTKSTCADYAWVVSQTNLAALVSLTLGPVLRHRRPVMAFQPTVLLPAIPPTVRHLDLSGYWAIDLPQEGEDMNSWGKLRSLGLWMPEFGDLQIERICRTCRHLHVFSADITMGVSRAVVARVMSLPRLTRLCIGFGDRFDFLPAPLPVHGASGLTHLDLHGLVGMKDPDVKVLGLMPNLTHLGLNDAPFLSDESLRLISKAEKLRSVVLSNFPVVSDTGICLLLSKLLDLRQLGLSQLPQLTAKGLAGLPQLPELYRLGLDRCPGVTLEKLKPVAKQCPKLDYLEVSGTDATVKQIHSLGKKGRHVSTVHKFLDAWDKPMSILSWN